MKKSLFAFAVSRLAVLTPIVALGAAVAGCGGGGGGSNADAFVGTWTFTTGALTPTGCSFGGVAVNPIDLTGGQLVISKVDDGHVSSGYGSACTITFATAGNTATAAPSGQSCTVAVPGSPISVVISVSQWTLAISGNSMTTHMAGAVPLLTGCSATGTGSLTKGGDAGPPTP